MKIKRRKREKVTKNAEIDIGRRRRGKRRQRRKLYLSTWLTPQFMNSSNPIIRNERIYFNELPSITDDGHHNLVKQLEIGQESTALKEEVDTNGTELLKTLSIDTIWNTFLKIFHNLKLLLFLLFQKKHNLSQREQIDTKEIDINTLSINTFPHSPSSTGSATATATDSDIELIAERNILTNDFHLIGKKYNNRSQYQQNSILVDVDDVDESGAASRNIIATPNQSFFKAHQLNNDNTGETLRALALKKLALGSTATTKPTSTNSQYGTDLSIAKPIRYTQKKLHENALIPSSMSPRLSSSSLPPPPSLLISSRLPAQKYSSNGLHSERLLSATSFLQQYRNTSTPMATPKKTNDKYKEHIMRYYAQTKPKWSSEQGTSYPTSSATAYLDNLISSLSKKGITSTVEQAQSKIQELITRKRLQESQVGVKGLTEQQLKQVYQIWKSDPRKLVIEKFNIDLKVEDLLTLRDGNWLNDIVIDFYINLLMDASNDKVFGWTTHFYTTLERRGYQGVAKWAKKRKLNLFKKEKVIVPVNISQTHWALAVIDNVAKTITYYDSLDSSGMGNSQAVSNLQMYMDGEAKQLGIQPILYEQISHIKCPQQSNGFDCGVFVCAASRYIVENKTMNYSQKDMKMFRRRMVYEMMTTKLVE